MPLVFYIPQQYWPNQNGARLRWIMISSSATIVGTATDFTIPGFLPSWETEAREVPMLVTPLLWSLGDQKLRASVTSSTIGQAINTPEDIKN